MKKVLFVIESLGGGGAEKVLTTIIKYLDKTQFDITVLLVAETGVYVDEVKKYCKVQSMLPEYEKLNNFIDKIRYKLEYKYIYSAKPENVYAKYVKEKYDIEIAFVEGYATKFVMGSSNVKSKKICWVHIDMEKNPYADQYFKNLLEENKIYNRYDKIVCVSNSVKKVLEHKFGLENEMVVVYNPIDKEDILEKAVEKQLKHNDSLIQLVTVGRLEKQKGYDRLINALAIIKREYTNFKVWILGEGSMRDELERLILNNHLEKEVEMLGFKKNPYEWIGAADAFICTSRAEGFSLVIAEAMTLGKPVLSVDCAGPNELLDYGKYGVLVENTEKGILKMLHELLSGKIELNDLKKLSEKRAKDFNLETTVRQIEEIMK